MNGSVPRESRRIDEHPHTQGMFTASDLALVRERVRTSQTRRRVTDRARRLRPGFIGAALAGVSPFALLIASIQIVLWLVVLVLASRVRLSQMGVGLSLWERALFGAGLLMLLWQFATNGRWRCRIAMAIESQLILVLAHIFSVSLPYCFETLFLLNLYSFTLYDRPVMAVFLAAIATGEWFVVIESTPYSWTLPVLSVIVVTSGCRMTHFQEQLINIGKDNQRLGETLSRMDRATREYQEQLLTMEAKSSVNERNRITRDIHDIVGYALTNNIMLIEMATSIMNTDQLKAFGILHRAKENARDGMHQVRDTLYALRATPSRYPHGLEAISQTIKFFRKATGIEIDLNIGGTEWKENREIDKTVLYLIKEGLLNSFRHGKATRVAIQVNTLAGELEVRLRDNGMKTEGFREGIGLKGTRERISRLNGTLEARNLVDGFLLRALIPIDEMATDENDPHSDR